MRIRKAHSVDAEALPAIAHAAKGHWRFPEEYRLWRDELTVTTDFKQPARREPRRAMLSIAPGIGLLHTLGGRAVLRSA